MDDVLKAGRWETVIDGVKFTSYRRNAATMIRARGFAAVVGQVEAKVADGTVTEEDMMRVTEVYMRAALISPAIAPVGEPTIEGVQYTFADLAFAAQKWLIAFMDSGVTVDPTQPSCEA
jgi:glutathione S-transferase